MSDLHDEESLARTERAIDGWLAAFAAASPAVRRHRPRRRDDRVGSCASRGEAKDFTTVWLTLGQRTLRYETYVMPAPEANAGELYEHLLRRNERLVGAHFSIGVEDAVFLRGELTVSALTAAELDRAIGTLYATVEQCFPTLVRIGFPRAFRSQA